MTLAPNMYTKEFNKCQECGITKRDDALRETLMHGITVLVCKNLAECLKIRKMGLPLPPLPMRQKGVAGLRKEQAEYYIKTDRAALDEKLKEKRAEELRLSQKRLMAAPRTRRLSFPSGVSIQVYRHHAEECDYDPQAHQWICAPDCANVTERA